MNILFSVCKKLYRETQLASDANFERLMNSKRPCYFYVSTFLVVLTFTCMNSQQESCTSDPYCGTNSKCINDSCICKDGFKKHGAYCIDEKCEYGKCYKCKNTKCQRCVTFVIEDSGKCVDTCSTTSSLKLSGDYQGRVCKASETEKKLSEAEIIGIVVGVVLVIIIVVVVLALFCYFRINKSSDETPSNRSGDGKTQSNSTRQSNEPRNRGSADDKTTSQEVGNNDDDKHVTFQKESKNKDTPGTDHSQAKPRPKHKDSEV